MVGPIGVLALQGDFSRHLALLAALGREALAVRYPEDLVHLAALIFPGGESTTISKQLDRSGLREAVTEFSRERPVLGTCAGLILMAKDPSDARVHSLGLLDIVVTRNNWGRQVHSFTVPVDVQFNGRQETVSGIFIRAPRIQQVEAGVEVLASINSNDPSGGASPGRGEPVLVRQGQHMGATFHPELTHDTRIHQLFLEGMTG